MERLSDKAIEIINGLHAERLDYETEYIPLIETANRLSELEDKLESGKLLEFPCKVGDPVYTVYLDDDDEFRIAETSCIGFNIREGDIDIITNFCCYDPFRYGKFTDKAQAESRLKELQEKGI